MDETLLRRAVVTFCGLLLGVVVDAASVVVARAAGPHGPYVGALVLVAGPLTLLATGRRRKDRLLTVAGWTALAGVVVIVAVIAAFVYALAHSSFTF